MFLIQLWLTTSPRVLLVTATPVQICVAQHVHQTSLLWKAEDVHNAQEDLKARSLLLFSLSFWLSFCSRY
jgi:hypothetical protein